MNSSDGIKKALIISVSDYQDESLENLKSCKNDGDEMFKVLTKLGYEIPSERKLVGKVNSQNMKEAIIQFYRDDSVNPQDTLLFYFSGHGLLDGYGGRFFANTQTGTTIPEEYGIPFNFLTEQMQKTDSDKTVAILDCCFSGSAALDVVNKFSGSKGEEESEKLGREALENQFAQSQGTCVLASSLSNRLSYMLPDKPFSAFTYYVLEGLKGHKDAVDNEGCVTPTLLSQFIFSKLSKIKGINQKPIRNISVAGKIILAQHPKPKPEIKAESPSNFGKENVPKEDGSGQRSNILRKRKIIPITIIAAVLGIAIISGLVYPQDPVPPSGPLSLENCKIADSDGHWIVSLKIHQKVWISCDLFNEKVEYQKFNFRLQTIDKENGKGEYLRWIDDVVPPGKTFNAKISWSPSRVGTFEIMVAVGEDLNSVNKSKWSIEQRVS